MVVGLAVALAVSVALNVALLILPRTRETVLSLVRRTMSRVHVGRLPSTTPPPSVPVVSNARPETSGTVQRPPPPPLPVRSVRPRPLSQPTAPTTTHAPPPAPTRAPTPTHAPTLTQAQTPQPFRTGNETHLICYQICVCYLNIVFC